MLRSDPVSPAHGTGQSGFRRDLDVGRSSVPDRASVRYVGRVCGVRGGGNRVPKRLLPGAAFNFRDSPRVVYAR